MPSNDISYFLLKEYECLSEAFFEARDVTAKWIKYYLIIMAAPFSFVAIIKQGAKEYCNGLGLGEKVYGRFPRTLKSIQGR